MAERTPAPGQVRQLPVSHLWVAACLKCKRFAPAVAVYSDISRPMRGRHRSIAAAADALREHLRTEHADLWRECTGCAGAGVYAYEGDDYCCIVCHGRGYVERSQP